MKRNVFLFCSLFIGILSFTSQSQSGVYDLGMNFTYSGKPPIIFKLMCNDVEVCAFNYGTNIEFFTLESNEMYLTFVLIAVMADAEYPSPPYIFTIHDIIPAPSQVQGFQMSKRTVTIKMNYRG